METEFEVNLICPECGCYKFHYDWEAKEFCCPECEWRGTTDEMEVHVY